MHERTKRVASLLTREVSRVLREEIHEPGPGFVTVLGTDVAKDLKSARVYYSVMGSDSEKEATERAVEEAAGEIKRAVNDCVRLRYAIDLKFIRDESTEEAFRIQKVMERIRREREEREGV